MISELDLYRAANLVIKRHGAEAVIEAARMIDCMLELGDVEGRDLWRRIRRAIETLEAPADGVRHWTRRYLVSPQPQRPAQKPTTRMERRARSRTDRMTERRALSWDGVGSFGR